MESVLLVSHTNTVLPMLADMFSSQMISRIVPAQNGAEARRSLIDTDFDLIIIDAPLPDEFGDDFALYASEKSSAGIMLLVKSEMIYDMDSSIEEAGVFIMPKPATSEFFYQAAKLLTASRRRVMKLESENEKLQKKISEIRLVDRAKCILIQYLNMTEPQAHRYIEKQAMDLRQSRLVTAQNILKTYEN
ncbi:MAG: ANTAR domain-containing protein [Treponema sp.]|nr:ANTAR domain-containing protein [Treponema sp.]